MIPKELFYSTPEISALNQGRSLSNWLRIASNLLHFIDRLLVSCGLANCQLLIAESSVFKDHTFNRLGGVGQQETCLERCYFIVFYSLCQEENEGLFRQLFVLSLTGKSLV